VGGWVGWLLAGDSSLYLACKGGHDEQQQFAAKKLWPLLQGRRLRKSLISEALHSCPSFRLISTDHPRNRGGGGGVGGGGGGDGEKRPRSSPSKSSESATIDMACFSPRNPVSRKRQFGIEKKPFAYCVPTSQDAMLSTMLSHSRAKIHLPPGKRSHRRRNFRRVRYPPIQETLRAQATPWR